MTEEEYIRNRLDMINRNSVYGLCAANSSEIANIVHNYIVRGIACDYDRLNCPKPPIHIGPVKVKTLKERLEEATMHADCEFCVKRNICTRDVPKPCRYKYTEEDGIADDYAVKAGAIFNATYLPETYQKKEEQKMNATSVQVINNVKDMNVTFEKSPLEETRIIMSVSTDDDTYEINCSGSITYGLYDKDYIDKLRKEIHDLIAENTELKTKLHDTSKEGDYIIYNGSPYTPSDIERLLTGIRQLEELKTPTIENFADEEPADNVNHPSHYTGKYECIEVMQDVFGNEATDNFCLCNAFKYIWRARKKNGLEDVKKAVWYLNKYIEEAEKDGVSKGE